MTFACGNFEVLWGWSLELVVIKLQQFLHISLILFYIAFFLALNTEEFAFPYSLKQEDQFVVSKA